MRLVIVPLLGLAVASALAGCDRQNPAEGQGNQTSAAEPEINAVVDDQALALAPRRADLEKEAATIYAKTFTQDELKAIADFYNSPVGKKLLSDGPIATREVVKAAEIWANGVDRDLRAESGKKLDAMIGTPAPAEGGEAQTQQQ